MAKKRETVQLDKDSSASIAANMSYGMYMAMQYEVGARKTPDKIPEKTNTVCRYCGKAFWANHKNRTCCSDECRKEHYKVRNK